jgi:hypothetical protein
MVSLLKAPIYPLVDAAVKLVEEKLRDLRN